MAGLVWVIRKLHYIIESNRLAPVTIFTDYSLLVSISKKSNLTSTVSIEKLNLRLVRVAKYFLRFQLDIQYKPGKANFVSDALSRLATVNNEKKSDTKDSNKGELDALFAGNTSPDESIREEFYIDFNENYIFTATLVEIEPAFKKQFLDGYEADKR
jgi:hypothetical protein